MQTRPYIPRSLLDENQTHFFTVRSSSAHHLFLRPQGGSQPVRAVAFRPLQQSSPCGDGDHGTSGLQDHGQSAHAAYERRPHSYADLEDVSTASLRLRKVATLLRLIPRSRKKPAAMMTRILSLLRRESPMGWSRGGYGAWSIAVATPGRWSAVVPLAGGGDSNWSLGKLLLYVSSRIFWLLRETKLA